MADVHGKEARSRNMSAIRQKNTKPEIWLRSMLHRRGYRFRIHVKELPGTPDIVLPKHKAVIFMNGCFWHMHNCHLFKVPATRTEFWKEKLTNNFYRDQRNISLLKELGWRVLIVWECAIRGKQKLELGEFQQLVVQWIQSDQNIGSIRNTGMESD